MRGVDYAWANPKPAPSTLKADGVGFVVRYVSADPSKDLTAAEKDALLAAGIEIALVWETDGVMSGAPAGAAAAKAADQFAHAMNMPGIPVYFACDQDPRGFTAAQWHDVDTYLDAAAGVISRTRTGGYGAYDFAKHCFDNGKIHYGYQTYAWSAGKWDPRAQLRQIQNGVTLRNLPGLSCDLDDSMASDFGQWPRPKSPPTPGTVIITETLPVLAEGATGAHVAWAQVVISGFYGHSLTADGIFGPATKAGLIAIQTAHHLAATGALDAGTWHLLASGNK